MKKSKWLCRMAALLMAFVLLISIIPLGTATTLTAGDNIIIYLDFAPHFKLKERNAAGFPWMATRYCTDTTDSGGETLITSGEWVYCIEYDKRAEQGSVDSTATSLLKTPAWTNLSLEAQRGITYALIYGCPTYSNELYGYAATQLIIWEYQTGARTSATDNVTKFSETLSQSARLQTAYKTILSRIATHTQTPTFDRTEITLKGYGRENGITLTDTNGAFGNDTWSISGNGNGVVVEQDGNNLLVYATEQLTDGTQTKVSLKRQLHTTGNAVCSISGAQHVIIGTPPDPLSISLSVKMEARGKAKIVKSSDDGNNAGITFLIYDTETVGATYYQTFVTTLDNEGYGVITADLEPGSYTVREIQDEHTARYYPQEEQSFTVNAGETAVVRFHNTLIPATMEIHKTTVSGGSVDGYYFKVWGAASGIFYGKSDSKGKVYQVPESLEEPTAKVYTFTGLKDGEFSMRELLSATPGRNVFPDSWRVVVTDRGGEITYDHTFTSSELTKDTNGDCVTPKFMVSGLTGGGKMTMTIHNVPTTENLEIRKTSDDGSVAGIKFTVEESVPGNGYSHIGSYTTDKNGKITVPNLKIGTTYRITETVPEGYVCKNNAQIITIQAGKNQVRFENIRFTGSVQVRKYNAASTDILLSGAVFAVYKDNGDSVFDAAKDSFIGNLKEQKQGIYRLDGLYHGSYFLIETTAPEGFITDSTPHPFQISKADQLVSVTTDSLGFANAPYGAIEITKVNDTNEILAGAAFLLEFSVDDGTTWSRVAASTEETFAQIGTCSSPELVDGTLTSGADGKVIFSGLPVLNVRYRVTETKAPDGYTLLAEPVFEGQLTSGESGGCTMYFTVVNTPQTRLPSAGGDGMFRFILPASVFAGISGTLLLFILWRKRRSEQGSR